MDLMASETLAQRVPTEGDLLLPRAALLLTVSYKRHSLVIRIQQQREPRARLAPDMFRPLLPTTGLSGSSVGANE